jgi:hypothetical protein
MMQFAADFTRLHPDGGIMIQDNLRCHHNPEVMHEWETGGFGPRFLPPYGAKYGSPLDNSTFSSVKAAFRREDTSSKTKKKSAYRRVLRNLDPNVIRNSYTHCGYVPLGESDEEDTQEN